MGKVWSIILIRSVLLSPWRQFNVVKDFSFDPAIVC